MYLSGLLAAVLLAVGGAGRAGPAQDPLVQARQLYNGRQYDAAIAAAELARKNPKTAAAAAIVIARARLERFRSDKQPDDLTASRDLLAHLDTSKLLPGEQLEYLMGLGESMYCEDEFAAAAATFEIVLDRTGSGAPIAGAPGSDDESRQRLFEWWAGSLDQQAQFGADTDRRAIYSRILDRAADELGRNAQSAVATYWLAAAARGVDDIGRAWGAAVAGWIRAASMPGHTDSLRADLDRLIIRVILPERARRLAPSDPAGALAGLRQEWDRIKAEWGGDGSSQRLTN